MSLVNPNNNKSMPLSEFREKLEKVVHARGEPYEYTTACILYWEDDRTGAKQDALTLQGIFEDVFGFNNVELYEIPKATNIPGFEVLGRLNDHERSCMLYNRHTLMMIAYMGHASINSVHDTLQLTSESGKQYLNWSTISRYTANACDTVDTLAILDCCYAGKVTRGNGALQASQILATCDASNTTRARTRGVISFTQRLASAARSLSTSAKTYIDVEELYDEMQRTKPPHAPNSVLHTIHSGHPIVLPFKKPQVHGQALSRVNTPRQQTTTVLFSMTVSGGPDIETMKQFSAAVQNLPSELKVEICDAYASKSIVVILRSSWGTFCRFSKIASLRFIAEVHGEALPNPTTSSFGLEIQNLPRQKEETPPSENK